MCLNTNQVMNHDGLITGSRYNYELTNFTKYYVQNVTKMLDVTFEHGYGHLKTNRSSYS